MADNPFAQFSPDQGGNPFSKFGPPPPAAEKSGIAAYIPDAILDVPHEAYQATADALGGVKDTFVGRDPVAEGTIGGLLKTGKGVLSAASVPFAPFYGAARSLLGHPLADTEHLIGTVVNPTVAAKDNRAEMYAKAKADVDTALSALAAAKRPPVAVPPAPIANGPLGVTLSKGQLTGELPLIQQEQGALRGSRGAPAQAAAQEFVNQQRGEVVAAKDAIAKGLDPYGQTIAETPQEAGALASQGVQQAADIQKAGVKAAYKTAQDLGGEIHAGAFEGIAQKIKGDLSLRDDPVIIDEKTTPHADKALQDIERTIDRLRIPNRADPFGQPNPENIVGVNLKGVEQIRKRLSTFRKDAWSSGNAADGRAASAVVDAFDKKVDAAVDGGLFNGDPKAVQAWKDARAAHADYSGTFTAGKNDPVGRVVERIMGKGKNEAAIPNDVADFIYGSGGVNPTSLNVGVAKRIKGILGDQSPEWAGIRQGLFSRLTEPAPGMTDFGPGKIAQRVNRFLNGDGKEMANIMFSPLERQVLQSFADLHRALEVPQSGANWSNTAAFLAPMLKSQIAEKIGGLVGSIFGNIGHAVGSAGVGKVSSMFGNAREAKQVALQMPIITDAIKRYQQAVSAAARSSARQSKTAVAVAASNLSRALGPLGVNFETLQMSGAGRADPEQKDVPRPPGQ